MTAASFNERFLTPLAPPGELVDWRLAVCWRAATESGLLDALPGTFDEVAERAGVGAEAARAVLHVIATFSLVSISGHRVEMGPRRLSAEDAVALSQHGVWVQRSSALALPRLTDRTSTTPRPAERPPVAQGLQLLAHASRENIVPVVDACLQAAPEARQVLDLGGGHGEYSVELARRGCSVTMQDLPAAIDVAREDERFADITLVAASFFEHVAPGPFDLVLCSTVTNMFDERQCRELVEAVRPVLAPGGTLALVSFMRDRDPVGTFFGLQMLASTDGGDAHASTQYQQWLADAGYVSGSVIDLVTPPLTVVTATTPPP